jgi:hypothetical protein
MNGALRPATRTLESAPIGSSLVPNRGDAYTLPRNIQQSHRAFFKSLCADGALFGALTAVLFLLGCGGARTVPVGNAAENIRKLALGYVQFAATNQGIGPINQEALKKFLMQRSGLSPQEVDAAFTSPRDDQPYEVFWGQRPMGTRPIGHDPPKPAIIIVEATGAGGTRYIADGQLSIKEMPAAEIADVLSKAKAPEK